GVLGPVEVAQHAPANAEYHWAVALHENGKGVLVALSHKAIQQLRVGSVGGISRCSSELLEQGTQGCGHGCRFSNCSPVSSKILDRTGRTAREFRKNPPCERPGFLC